MLYKVQCGNSRLNFSFPDHINLDRGIYIKYLFVFKC